MLCREMQGGITLSCAGVHVGTVPEQELADLVAAVDCTVMQRPDVFCRVHDIDSGAPIEQGTNHVDVVRHRGKVQRGVAAYIGRMQIGAMLGGSVLVETVFAWPGLGRLAYTAVFQRDINLLLGLLFMCSLMVIITNIVTEVAYRLIDPRISME